MLDRHIDRGMLLGRIAAMLSASEHELLRRLVTENGGRYGEVCGIDFDRLESKGLVLLHGQRGERTSSFLACSVTAKGKALLAQMNRTNGHATIGHANGHTLIAAGPGCPRSPFGPLVPCGPCSLSGDVAGAVESDDEIVYIRRPVHSAGPTSGDARGAPYAAHVL